MTPNELRRIEAGRWFLLQAIGAGDDLGIDSEMAHQLVSVKLSAYTEKWVRREADYLGDKGLVRIEKHPVYPPRYWLTGDGRDVVDYLADCPVGIHRPQFVGE